MKLPQLLNRWIFVLALSLAGHGYADIRPADPLWWDHQRPLDVDYLDAHAWEKRARACVTYILNNGLKVNDEIHSVAAGRAIYSYIYGAAAADHPTKGAAMGDFLLLNMVNWRDPKPYFRSLVGLDGEVRFKEGELSGDIRDVGRKRPRALWIHEQAYPLTGLLALLHGGGSSLLHAQVQRLYDSFYARFHDPDHGGFVETYSLDDDQRGTRRSFQSTVYPMTAFLFSLHEATHAMERQDAIRATLLELSDHIVDHLYDPATGTVREVVGLDWQPPVDGERPYIIAGHSFQAAWALLRMVQKTHLYVLGDRPAKYRRVASKILHSLYKRGAFDPKHGGVYNGLFVDAAGGFKWGTSKAWWQQVYAVLAVTLAEKLDVPLDREILAARDRAVEFYFKHFVDPAGGVFREVSEDGLTVLSREKGQPGAWAFHHTEFAQWMSYYLRPISDAAANDPYPNEAISGGSPESSTPAHRRRTAFHGREYRRTLPYVP